MQAVRSEKNSKVFRVGVEPPRPEVPGTLEQNDLYTVFPNYKEPNKWGLQGTWRHPGGAGFDNRRTVLEYELGTPVKELKGRGDVIPRMEGQGRRKVVDSTGMTQKPVTFQDSADQISGHRKLRGARATEVDQIMGTRFLAATKAAGKQLATAIARERFAIFPAETKARK